jgi:uncharacterized Zn ribbon protein
VFVFDANGNRAYGDSLNFFNQSFKEELINLRVIPSEIVFTSMNDWVKLYVEGDFTFTKGVDLSGAANGTLYVSADPSIAAVGRDGVVSPRGDGDTFIMVKNSGKTVNVPVKVKTGDTLRNIKIVPDPVIIPCVECTSTFSVKGFFSLGATADIT